MSAETNTNWTDEELEMNAIAAATEAAGNAIESESLADKPLSSLTPVQFQSMIQQAAWAYMQVYIDYIPF